MATQSDSKLIQLLKSLTPAEWKRLRLYVESPYFNQNETITALFANLFALATDLDRATPAQIYRGVTQLADLKQINYLQSDLLQLCYGFLALEQLYLDQKTITLHTLEALSDRGLTKHHTLIFDRNRSQISRSAKQDAAYHLSLYQIENHGRAHMDKQGVRRVNEHLQPAIDHLDHFYLHEKLKYTCAMLNSQRLIAAPFAFRYLAELKTFFETNPLDDLPLGIRMYYAIFRMLTQSDADTEFAQLKNWIAEAANAFEREEMTNISGYALNYCINKIRLGREEYVQEALNLYQNGITSGILLEGGRLSPWHFKNIIKLALRSQQYTWTEQFILQHNHLLDDHFKDDALHYNLAELHFYTNQYNKALTHLNRVEFTDMNYNLGAKEMLIKIYFEQDENDALESLLHAFKIFLQRNRMISEPVRRTYLHFIRLVKKVQRVQKKHIPALRIEIESTEPVAARQWLLDQIA
jgi:hypothetical protein